MEQLLEFVKNNQQTMPDKVNLPARLSPDRCELEVTPHSYAVLGNDKIAGLTSKAAGEPVGQYCR